MKNKSKYLSGIFGLISGVLIIVVWVVLLAVTNKFDGDAGDGIGLAIILIVAIPEMFFNGIIAAVIFGLSISALVSAGKNKINKGVLISVAIFEILAGATVAFASVMLWDFIGLFLLFLATAVICIVFAIITLILKTQLSKQLAEESAAKNI